MYPPYQQQPQPQPPMQGYPAPYGPPGQPSAGPGQYGTPRPPAEKGRWKRFLPIASMVMLLIGMIFSLTAINSSVYNVHVSGAVWTISIEVDETLYYDHIDNKNSMLESNTTTYEEMKFYNVGDQIEQYYLLVIAGTVMMAVTMAMGLIVFFRKMGPVPVGIIGIFAAIMCILGPVLLSAGLPGAFEADSKASGNDLCSEYQGENTPCKSFSGESNINTGMFGIITMTWGPTNGYYLSMVSFVFAMVGAFLIFPSPRPVRRSAQSQQPAPGPAPQPGYYGNIAPMGPPSTALAYPPQHPVPPPSYQSQTSQPPPLTQVPPEGPPPDLPGAMGGVQYGAYPEQRPPPGPRTY